MKQGITQFHKYLLYLLLLTIIVFLIKRQNSVNNSPAPKNKDDPAMSTLQVGGAEGAGNLTQVDVADTQNLTINAVTFGKVALAGGHYASLANFKADDLVSFTNAERQARKLTILTTNEQLTKSAQLKCEHMVQNNYWSHNTPDGTEPWVFLEKVNYSYRSAGENLGYGYTSPTSLVSGWMKSVSHRDNILNTRYTSVGFGVCEAADYMGRGHFVIVVQHLAAPL